MKMVGNDWENSLNGPNSSESLPNGPKMSQNVPKCAKLSQNVPKRPLQTHRCPNGLVSSSFLPTFPSLFPFLRFFITISSTYNCLLSLICFPSLSATTSFTTFCADKSHFVSCKRVPSFKRGSKKNFNKNIYTYSFLL